MMNGYFSVCATIVKIDEGNNFLSEPHIIVRTSLSQPLSKSLDANNPEQLIAPLVSIGHMAILDSCAIGLCCLMATTPITLGAVSSIGLGQWLANQIARRAIFSNLVKNAIFKEPQYT